MENGNTFETFRLIPGSGDGDNAVFAIDSNDNLVITQAVSRSVKDRYSVRIRSTDPSGNTVDNAFVFLVDPRGIDLSGATVFDKSPTGTRVGQFSTVQVGQGSTFAYNLVSGAGSTDNSRFTVDSDGQLSISEVANLALKDKYSIRVRSTDQLGRTFESVFEITVVPNIIFLSRPSVIDQSPAGTVIDQLFTSQPGTTNTFTYSLVSGNGSTDNSRFAIDGNGNLIITEAVNAAVKNSYAIRIRSVDQYGTAVESKFTIAVIPTGVSLPLTTIDDGSPAGTLIGDFRTTAPGTDNTYTYSLVTGTGGTDNSRFTIDAEGALTISEAVDFTVRSTYSIRVRSTDQLGNMLEAAIPITVTPVPLDITLANNSIAESQAIGTVVGHLTTQEAGTGNTFSYNLVGGEGSADNASFSIDATGKVVANEPFVYSVKSSYSIRVQTTDQRGREFEKAFTITILPGMNHAPVVVPKDFLISENSANGAFIGTIASSDVDLGQSRTYAITAGNTNNAFAINAATGVLTVNNTAALNYEAIQQFNLMVTVTDNGTPEKSATAACTVFLRNVNEGPSLSGTLPHQPMSDAASMAPFAALKVTDPDTQNMFARVTILNGVVRGDFTAASTNGWTRKVSGNNILYERFYAPQANIGSVVQTAIRAFVFQPRTNAIKPNTTELTDISVFVNDGVSSTTATTRLTTTSVNNAPAISDASNTVKVNDNATVNPLASLTVDDADLQEMLLSVTILNGINRGDFTNAIPANGWTVRQALGNNITYKRYLGPQANIGAAAQAAFRALVFRPRQNFIKPGTSELTDFQVTVSDGVATAVANTGTRVTTTSVNNAPAIGGAVANQTMNDNQTKAVFSTLTVTDPDTQDQFTRITITGGTTKGDFTAASTVGWTRKTSGANILYERFFAAAANNGMVVQTAIRALVFQPRTNVPIGTTETTSFSVFVNDGLANVTNSTTSISTTGVAPRPASSTVAPEPLFLDRDITTVVLPLTKRPTSNPLARLLKKSR